MDIDLKKTFPVVWEEASMRICVFFFFCRRSYVGVELVQWLCEQCVYVRCRTTAVRVWQVLLELGVLLSGNKNISIIKRSLSPKKT